MIAGCAPVPTGPGFLAGALRFLDCHAVGIAEQSFAFLGQPGSPAYAMLLTALTLLIVIFGFRLMFGHRPDLGDVTSAALRVGIVLALAGSWPAVSAVIARPVLAGPAELVAWTGPAASLPDRLGRVDSGIAALTSWGSGRNDIRAPRTADGDYSANAAATVSLADSIALAGARVSFLLTAIASLGVVRLLAGVLIGLAPVFAGLLLFERTRGIFAGWARALFGLIVAGAALALVLRLELALLEPWIAEVIAQRQASLSAPSAPTELLAMTMAFGLISAGVIVVIIRLCLALELPAMSWRSPPLAEARRDDRPPYASVARVTAASAMPERVLQTVEGLDRIEQHRSASRRLATSSSAPLRPAEPSAAAGLHLGGANAQSGGKSQLGGRGRTTLMAQRRDRKA